MGQVFSTGWQSSKIPSGRNLLRIESETWEESCFVMNAVNQKRCLVMYCRLVIQVFSSETGGSHLKY